jgi:tRNA(Ile)-lysidine synthase
MSDLQTNVRRTIETRGLLRPGDTVVVAVSGGADSVALAHLLADLRSEYDLTLHVAHLNHQLREEAAQDAEFVRALASELGLPVVISAVDIRALAAAEKRSLEEAGRQARYALCARVATATGASRVATAHTCDDQIETVAMRLLQGAAWGALAGIPVARPLGPVTVVRPLFEATRAQILEYLHTRRLPWRQDSTNRDQRFLRNWVRLTWLPSLDGRVPQGRRLLWEVGTLAREADQLLQTAADRMLAVAPRTRQTITFSLATLRKIPPNLRRRVMRLAVREINGTELPPHDVSVLEARDVVLGRVGEETRVARCVVRRGYDSVEVTVAPPAAIRAYGMPVPGRVDASDFGVVVTADVLERSSLPAAVPGRAETVYLDARTVGSSVTVRPWRSGDRFSPLGLRGSKKVHDILIDGKVPRWLRSRVPLVTDADDRILWIVGHAIAESAKVTPATAKVVRLRVGPPGSQPT